MFRSVYLMVMLVTTGVNADTINHFMNIASNIPQMEMKADPQSQAWAHSARTILILTTESITETLTLANETARAAGHPLFCIPAGVALDPASVNELIQSTYRELSSQQSDKDQMTVSQIALLGLRKKYPCTEQTTATAQTGAAAQTGAWPGQPTQHWPGQSAASQ
ncbi:MAG: phosphatase [Legionellales bacterium]|nr:phosphatase [Legionellales bacterium]